METGEDGPDWPEVNLETIKAYYSNDVKACFPHDPRWWDKPFNQPHSGVPVPKRIVKENTQSLRIMGGDTTTELYPAAERRNWRDSLWQHNLVLVGKQGGKRSYADVRPMAPSPAAPPDRNDPRGSCPNVPGAYVSDQSNDVSDPWSQIAQPSSNDQGASSSSSQGVREAAQTYWEPNLRPTYHCPICNHFTPRGTQGFGYCEKCRGVPGSAISGSRPDRAAATRGTPPWVSECIICAPAQRYGDNTGTWTKHRRR